ncbi:uncharacterized protein LOC121381203 [Gigantopelta aegis]|uniref:uncharacterized protein LOC121381203 n=1 Tax=Gigantopelta aegis TaxID=1735272 RepID=UPI001B888152|nr:uncharacterized protein LOC121381203 [Gigantopelta aegis]
MTDGPSSAKKSKTDSLPLCPYGARCYRTKPNHFLEFAHNKDGGDKQTDAGASKVSDAAIDLPACKYGAKCYRKNLLHFAEYSHPTAKPGDGKKNDIDSGSDTDPVDSEEDEKKSPQKDSKDILNRGMSLVKSFSQMSENERKELIKKAFEMKQKLQKELEETKKQVEEKDKQLNTLQEQVNRGLLLVEGEEAALEGDKTVYFTLEAERVYKEGSAAQIHFRLAESQFYRLTSGPSAQIYRVSKVEYVVNPKTQKLFKEARETLKKTRGEEYSYPVLAFHGTQQNNITPICETGFKVPGDTDFKHSTDTGWFGKGVYFSEFPGYSIGYIKGATKLLLCQVLTGKVFQCTKVITGAALTKGYDSHTSPDKKELVIFKSAHILPSYIVHYTTANTEFKYTSEGSKLSASTSSGSGYADIQNADATGVFKDQRILFSGEMQTIRKNMQELLVKHEGSAGTVSNMTLLVASQKLYDSGSRSILTAKEKKVPVVKEQFIYDCINAKKFLDIKDYLHA